MVPMSYLFTNCLCFSGIKPGSNISYNCNISLLNKIIEHPHHRLVEPLPETMEDEVFIIVASFSQKQASLCHLKNVPLKSNFSKLRTARSRSITRAKSM